MRSGRFSVLVLLVASSLGAWLQLGVAQVAAPAPESALELSSYQQFALRVSDLERSAQFYTELFGQEPVERGGELVFALGSGPQHFVLTQARAGETPGFAWIGLSVERFEADALSAAFAARGFTRHSDGESAALASRRYWQRGTPNAPRFFFTDAEGIVFRLMAADDCSGCATGEFGDGVLDARGINHFTNFVANFPRSNQLMRQVFGLGILAYQGPSSPTLSIGDSYQFLMYVGGQDESAPTQAGRTDHVSLSVEGFDVDAIRARLTQFGLTPAEGRRPPEPLTHWVSLRQPNRGGAQGGTPELYFSDPDGIAIQVQHPSYCGGGGYLGDECE